MRTSPLRTHEAHGGGEATQHPEGGGNVAGASVIKTHSLPIGGGVREASARRFGSNGLARESACQKTGWQVIGPLPPPERGSGPGPLTPPARSARTPTRIPPPSRACPFGPPIPLHPPSAPTTSGGNRATVEPRRSFADRAASQCCTGTMPRKVHRADHYPITSSTRWATDSTPSALRGD
jgi:hypothetical protein